MLEKDLAIDKYNLDSLCENQASLYFFYSEKLAKLDNELGDIKFKLKEMEAGLDIYFRTNGISPDIKTTEAAISSAITSNKEVSDLRKDVIEKQKEMNSLENMLKALDQKKKMLELLVQLYVHNYYCTDKDVGEAIQKMKTENINSSRMKKGE